MSDYPTEVLTDSPLVYWRLGEPSGTTANDDSGNGNDGDYIGTPTLGATGLLTGDADTAVTFDGTAGQRGESTATVVAAGTIATFACECMCDIPATGTGQLVYVGDATITDVIELYYIDGVVFFDFQGTGAYSPFPGAAAVGVHHLVGEFNGTDVNVYVDGVLGATSPFVDAGAVQTVADSFCVAGIVAHAGVAAVVGTLDEAAFYTHALGTTRVAAHYAAAITGGSIPLTDPLIFDTAREHLAVDLDLDWTAGDVTALLVLADTWTPSAGDDVVATILAAGATETSGTRQIVGTPTATVSGGDHRVYWDGDPIVYPGVLNAETFDTLVLYLAVTDDTDSYLIAAYNLGAQVGDGNNITLTPDTLGYVSI